MAETSTTQPIFTAATVINEMGSDDFVDVTFRVGQD